jgi:Family of unknown function (DUF6551)
MSENSFTEQYVPVGDLEVDRTVQRSSVDFRKVERLKRNWNPDAVGMIVVSQRNAVTKVVLDGQHRYLAYAQLTDNQGEMLAQVFTGLSLEQEAQLFLDTNYGNQPTLLDKFRVRVVAKDDVAVAVNRMVRSYGWDIGNNTGDGNISAVGALERIYKIGEALELEPHLLQSTLMVLTHAWGQERGAVQAVILEGIAALIGEDDVNLDLKRLETALKTYPGGPLGLHTDATALAALKQGKVTMAVAIQVTDHYNKGRKTKTLSPWRRHR